VRIFPPSVEIGDKEGFAPQKDIFKRAAFGTGLANLLRRVEDPMVLILDGPWGSGKTTFIKMLAGLLRQNGHPVIYFDSFANDYIDDAFLAIAAEVTDLSQKLKRERTAAHKKFLDKAARAGRAIIRSGAKIVVKAATLGALDAADITELKSIAKDVADEVGTKADDYVKALLSRQGEERKSIESFRTALSELVAILVPKSSDSNERTPTAVPLIFIVDELDRCKPNFALELLEKIKHVFSVSGIHFILATHLSQLETSVRFNYGTDIDARTYLQKFYNLIVHLPGDGKFNSNKIIRNYIDYLKAHLRLDENSLQFVEVIAEHRALTLRPVERIAVYISLAIAFTTSKNLKYFRPPPILAGLCILKTLEPDLFQKAKLGRLTLEEASAAFRFEHWAAGHSNDWIKDWWQFALSPDLNLEDEKWRRWSHSGMWEFNIDDRKDIVRIVANDVIDKMQIPEE
jgi:KAP-like P-loop domain-containing protein